MQDIGSTSNRRAQDRFIDQIVDGRVHGDAFNSCRLPHPLSLNPGATVTIAAACGNREAQAICEAWRFREPVTVMSSAELDALTERTHTVFTGRESDLADEK